MSRTNSASNKVVVTFRENVADSDKCDAVRNAVGKVLRKLIKTHKPANGDLLTCLANGASRIISGQAKRKEIILKVEVSYIGQVWPSLRKARPLILELSMVTHILVMIC